MKPMLRPVLLSLAVLIAVLPRCVDASTLHFILVADTLDDKIGTAMRQDLFNVATAFRNIADAAGMKLSLTQVSGDDLTATKVGRAIMDVQPDADDAVVFFYTGHGFRTSSSATPWPSISLKEDKGMELAAIFRTLDIKRPRLFVVVGNCCNNTIPDGLIEIVAVQAGRPANAQHPGCRKLFAEARGAVIASSSQPGEFSFCLPSQGGVFTMAFLNALYAELNAADPSWQNLMAKASSPIRLLDGNTQNPQYGFGGELLDPPSNSPPPKEPDIEPDTTTDTQPEPPPRPKPPAKPKPRPHPDQPSDAVTLVIDISGIQNEVYVSLATNGDTHRGEYELSGIGQSKQFFVSPSDRVFLDVSGIQNTVVLPAALKNSVQYDISGINNEIRFSQ